MKFKNKCLGLWLIVLSIVFMVTACNSYDEVIRPTETVVPQQLTPSPSATLHLEPTTPIPTTSNAIEATSTPSPAPVPTATVFPTDVATLEAAPLSFSCFADEMVAFDEADNTIPEKILFVHQLSPEQEMEFENLLNWDRNLLAGLYAFAFPDHQYDIETIHANDVTADQCQHVAFLYGSELSNPLIREKIEAIRVEDAWQQIWIDDRVYQGEDLSLAISVPAVGHHQEEVVLLIGRDDAAIKHGLYHYFNFVFVGSFDYIVADQEFPLEAGYIDPESNQIESYEVWEQKEWRVRESLHFKLFFRPSSVAQAEMDKIITFQESAYVRIRDMIGWVDRPVNIYLYESLEDKQEQLGIWGNGHSVPVSFSTHSVYAEDIKAIGGHETTHVIAHHTLAASFVPLLSEGLAVYLSGPEDSFKPEHSKVLSFLDNGNFIPLAQLADNMSFWQIDSAITYPLAGSFVKFLIEEYGITKFTQLYRETQPDNVPEKLEEIYNLSIPELEALWLATVHESQENLP